MTVLAHAAFVTGCERANRTTEFIVPHDRLAFRLLELWNTWQAQVKLQDPPAGSGRQPR